MNEDGEHAVLIGNFFSTHPNERPLNFAVPLHKVSKFSTVLGVVDPYNPMTMRPIG